MWHVCIIYTNMSDITVPETVNLKTYGVDKIILKWIFGKQGWKVWTGCIWLRTGTCGRPL
jgi:hypothetical protein